MGGEVRRAALLFARLPEAPPIVRNREEYCRPSEGRPSCPDEFRDNDIGPRKSLGPWQSHMGKRLSASRGVAGQRADGAPAHVVPGALGLRPLDPLSP